MAGQVPTPTGNLARTSILPYLVENLFWVNSLADV